MIDLGRNVTVADVDRMEDRLYITASQDSARKKSAFWVLLVLAAIIASAGVVADSTATVIGALFEQRQMDLLGRHQAVFGLTEQVVQHRLGALGFVATPHQPEVVAAIAYFDTQP